MNKKLKRLWVAALRGGHWKQIRGSFRTAGTNERCATGLLIDIGLDHGFKVEQMTPTGVSAAVMAMNDSGASFNEIADWVEENL